MAQKQRPSIALWIALLQVTAFSTTACSHPPASGGPVVSVQTALAVQKPIDEIISADAVLYPWKAAAITPKITAPVRKFYVQRGDRVHRGELLAALENRDLAAAVLENKGSYEQAEASYANTTEAGLPEEIQKAELDVRAAKQSLDAEQKLYESRKNLYRQGALPRKDLDQQQVAYVQAKNQYDIAAKHLAALLAVGKKQQMKAAAGQLTVARGKYAAAQVQLGYTEIRSPIDGLVSERPLYAGETANAGTPLITVVDISSVVARAHVPQQQAALLKVGDHARITAPGIDKPAPGIVTMVSPATDPYSTTIEIWVKATNPGGELRAGTTVQVSIVARHIPAAIVIPASALLQSPEGQDTVMIVGTGNKARAQKVDVGIRQAAEAQILSGLRAGERVITTGAYGLPDGTEVRWQSPEAESAGSKP